MKGAAPILQQRVMIQSSLWKTQPAASRAVGGGAAVIGSAAGLTMIGATLTRSRTRVALPSHEAETWIRPSRI